MPVQTIIELGNSYLWEQCSSVEEVSSASVSSLIHDLRDTMQAFREEHGFGLAIAAPQIGVLSRVIYVDTGPDGFRGPMINPQVMSESGDRIELWDSCFCFPRILSRVSRAQRVRVEYLDETGELQALEASGELAALLQHQIDHLDGVLAIERAVSPKSYMTRDEWERQGKPL
jgi:peptide deformylase